MRFLLMGLWACSTPSPEPVLPEHGYDAAMWAHLNRMQRVPVPPSPTNRVADDEAAATLGQKLFFDQDLAGSQISCATCHQPDKAFSNGEVLGKGVGATGRHVPTLAGAQFGEFFNWDGRADSMWMQALGPLEHPAEMNGNRLAIAHYMGQGPHKALYEQVFGTLPDLSGLPPSGKRDVNDGAANQAWESLTDTQKTQVNTVFVNVGKALEAYQRKLVPAPAPFDRYLDALLAGDVKGGGHLDQQQEAGLRLFLGRANCVACHSGPMFSDRAFHTLGVPEVNNETDMGRTRGAMTVLASEFNCRGPYSDQTEECLELSFLNPVFDDFKAAFKTPSLRNVTQSAPYMHNGMLQDLPSVLSFYSELPGEPLAGHRELTLQPLKLTSEETAALIAFLGALTSDIPEELTRP